VIKQREPKKYVNQMKQTALILRNEVIGSADDLEKFKPAARWNEFSAPEIGSRADNSPLEMSE